MNIGAFAEEIRQEVLAHCDAEGSNDFREERFTEVMIEHLKDANEIEDGTVCYHNKGGAKLNGYNFSNDGECLDLFVCCYRGTAPAERLTKSEANDHFKRLRSFLKHALEGKYRGIEEASPVFDAAYQIYEQREALTKARLFFLTDGIVSKAEQPDETVNGIEIKHSFWDMEKLHRFVTSGRQREVIEVDFKGDFGGAVPCIGTHDHTGEYRTYLAFFPGELLAKLYGRHGPRLLERNVRSFLQARGKINRGINGTIRTEPHRFLAYNNGISATAQQVKLENGANGTQLAWARDFQIVNGGQTTASIYHAVRKDKADLSGLSVQVKLTVLDDQAKVDEFVPLIAQFANSQNKVSAGDLWANNPFHVQMEALSRTTWAPAVGGTARQTHWYYERARGSYLDDKARAGTPSQVSAWETMNPLAQKFTKTDMAKFENTWSQRPHFVSLGAEKNFLKFTEIIAEGGRPAPDARHFTRLVAKAILFRSAEKIVSAEKFGGFRAQIVTYTLAWLAHKTAQRIDLEAIWQQQGISETLRDSIAIVSRRANEHIVHPPANRKNPGEWCKQKECWDAFRALEIKMPARMEKELVSLDRLQETPNGSAYVSDDSVTPEITAMAEVPAETWFKISHWAKETGNLAPWQRSIAFSLGRMSGRKPPSEKQAKQAVKILEEAQRLGFKAS
jgi:AIPR protein